MSVPESLTGPGAPLYVAGTRFLARTPMDRDQYGIWHRNHVLGAHELLLATTVFMRRGQAVPRGIEVTAEFLASDFTDKVLVSHTYASGLLISYVAARAPDDSVGLEKVVDATTGPALRTDDATGDYFHDGAQRIFRAIDDAIAEKNYGLNAVEPPEEAALLELFSALQES